jgi:hypothetical protein
VANKGYSGKDGGIPTVCAAGKYKASTGAEECTDCASNSGTADVTGSTAASACVANKGYSGKDGSTPTVCAAGKYKATTGAEQCADCPSSTNSAAGSDAMDDCFVDSDSSSGSGSGFAMATAASTSSTTTGPDWITIAIVAVAMAVVMAVILLLVSTKRDKVAPDQYGIMKKAFDVFDTDNSGALDKEEFRDIMSMQTNAKVESTLTDAEFETLFEQVDSDGSGVVSFDEYFVWAHGPQGWARPQHRNKTEADARRKMDALNAKQQALQPQP